MDPAAAGLTTCPDGSRKILDMVDCTGSGDVDMATQVSLPETGIITGLSGRQIQLSDSILAKCKGENVRLGIKAGYRLFPVALVMRMKKERRAVWDRSHRRVMNVVREQLGKAREEGKEVDELEAREAVLLSMEKSYTDVGPLYDVIAFCDSTWKVAIVEGGTVTEDDLLDDFRESGKWATFGGGVMMNYAVKIYDNGNTVSIVVDAGGHGTHVAGILAAWSGDGKGGINGIAPGAKIVSLKIGDSRLNSMETHQGLIRAAAYLLRHSGEEETDDDRQDLDRIRIDVVNMSFGEQSRDVNRGRFLTLINKLVYKHNVLFVSSAGNDGPALSSVSAPGGTSEALIGVGAYVTPSMLTQTYSYLHSEFGSRNNSIITEKGNVKTEVIPEKAQGMPGSEAVEGIPFTWSSRGPVTDGGLGVSICAPGGAIAPVPVWMLTKKMLLNGTSMSSPSAAGAVAVLISFLKQNEIPYTSALVRRAIENTARPLRPPGSNKTTGGFQGIESIEGCHSVFATGQGSIDALAACEYLERYAERRGVRPTDVSHLSNVISTDPMSQTTECVTSSEDGKESGTKIAAATDPNLTDSTSKHPALSPTENGRTVSENGPVSDAESESASTQDGGNPGPFFFEDWRFRVRVDDGSLARQGSSNPGCGALNTTRGIYLRGGSDTAAVHRAEVTVEAIGQKEESQETKRALASMEVLLSIRCEADWVEVPATVVLLGGGRSFPVVVNPVGLTPGRAHYAEVAGYVLDTEGKAIDAGPFFRVPVTVHKPERLVSGLMIDPLRNLPFSPGSVVRRFYEAPVGATYGILKVVAGTSNFLGVQSKCPQVPFGSGCTKPDAVSKERALPTSPADCHPDLLEGEGESNKSQRHDVISTTTSVTGSADARNFEAHIVQIGPRRHCEDLESRHYFTLRPGSVKEQMIRVQGGSTLELCLAQLWSCPGQTVIEQVELVFAGVVPFPSALHAFPGDVCFPRMEVACFLPSATAGDPCPQVVSGFTPRGTLSYVQRAIAPSKSKLWVLSQRDDLPEVGRIYQLVLEYSFEVFDSSCSIDLLFHGLNRAVYESEIEGGPFVIVHDKNKQYMFSCDIYPHERTLQKGEYLASVYIRHDRVDILESLRDIRMTVDYELPSEITLDAYESEHGACLALDSRRLSRGSCALETGERRAFYFGMPKKSAIPKWCVAGDFILGRMVVDKLLSGSGGSVKRGNYLPYYDLSMTIGPSNSSKSNGEDQGSKKTDEKSTEEPKKKKSDENTPQAEKNSETEEEEKTSEETEKRIAEDPDQWFEEAARKLKVKKLRSVLKEKKFGEFDRICEPMLKKYPEDNEILLLRIERFDVESCWEHRRNGLSEEYRKLSWQLLHSAEVLIERIDAEAVAAHFGMMIDPESSSEMIQRKSFENKRNQLVEGLFRKCRTVCHLSAWRDETKKGDRDAEFEKSLKDLGRWVSLDGKGHLGGWSGSGKMGDGTSTNEDLLLIVVGREEGRGRYGLALKLMENFYGVGSSKKAESIEMSQVREELLGKLGWTHLAEGEVCSRVLRFPRSFTPY